MPILISQLVMKPVLVTMAFVNLALVGAFTFLLLVPANGPRIVSSILPKAHHSADASQALPRAGVPLSSQIRSGVPSPASPTSATRVVPVEPFSHSAGVNGHARIIQSSLSEFTDVASISAVGNSGRQVSIGRAATFGPVAISSVAAAPEASTQPNVVTVPLAYTAPIDQATPSQSAALQRLQKDFADGVTAQAQDPNGPAYAAAWQSAQSLSDSNFEQQFGTQAFIQAQLAQVHGGTH